MKGNCSGSSIALFLAVAISLLILPGNLPAQTSTLPPAPDRYITDQAGVIDSSTLSRVNDQLVQFDKTTTNQVVVAIDKSLPSGTPVDAYCTDIFNAWGVGQKGKNNGVVLFVFINDRKLVIRTGTGVEKILSKEVCQNIVTQIIVPQFKQGHYAAGVQAGVNAIIHDLTNASVKATPP